MITGREMLRNEVEQVWQIDRREVIHHIYYLENGALVLKPETYDMQGWPKGEAERYTSILYECYDRGVWFYGLWEEGKIVGVAILDRMFIGRLKDQLQLKFLHVSRDYRQGELGRLLFELASLRAREWGARKMYISATPSERTVDFYLKLNAHITDEPDLELLRLEPEDIHLEMKLEMRRADDSYATQISL